MSYSALSLPLPQTVNRLLKHAFECLEFSQRVQDPAWLGSLPDVGTFWVDGRSLTLATVLRETWAAITAKPFEAALEFVGRHV